MSGAPRIGIVGATGAVGTVTLSLLAQRGYTDVRAFASSRSAGGSVAFGARELRSRRRRQTRSPPVTSTSSSSPSAPRRRGSSCPTRCAVEPSQSTSRRRTGSEPGIPLVVPEVNGARALEHDGIVANPNCCTIPLTCVLKPLHDAAGLARVRVATYQSVSGAGAQRMEALRTEDPADHNLAMDWTWEGDETDEESKLRAETRKIMELPDLPMSATTVRVPVLVGHAEAVWIEFDRPLSADEATTILHDAPSVTVVDVPTPKDAADTDQVLVGRIRPDRASEHGLALFLACDNLNKGAALNAIQIAELILDRSRVAA